MHIAGYNVWNNCTSVGLKGNVKWTTGAFPVASTKTGFSKKLVTQDYYNLLPNIQQNSGYLSSSIVGVGMLAIRGNYFVIIYLSSAL